MSNIAYEEFGLDYRLSQTTEFRRQKAEEYRHDTRNAKAVDLLSALSGSLPSPLVVTALNDAIVEYESTAKDVEFGFGPPPFEAKVSGTLGAIGFRWHPKNIDEVLTALTADAHLAAAEVASVRELR
jgi:hypothetical protein